MINDEKNRMMFLDTAKPEEGAKATKSGASGI